jgi:hypothetical protein
MKTCYKCNCEKPFEAFGRNKAKKDGYADECRACKSKQDALYRQNNDEKVRAQKRQAYHDARPQHGRKTWEEWAALRKENAVGDQVLKNIHNHKRRALMRKTPMSELDELVFQEAYNLASKREQVTGTKWHVDHIVPIFYKDACGLNNAFNIQVVPASWNTKKSNKSMAVFWPASKG